MVNLSSKVKIETVIAKCKEKLLNDKGRTESYPVVLITHLQRC